MSLSSRIMKEIAIAGSGPTGMLAGLALAVSGRDVALIGTLTDECDQRTTALMMPAIRFLEKLDIWQNIAPQAAPFSTIRIIDATNRLVRSPTVLFHASEIGEQAFGYNIPNIVLNNTLNNAITTHSRIDRIVSQITAYHNLGDHIVIKTANGEDVPVKLVIAADGRSSLARHTAGMETRNWTYPQTAIVMNFSHTINHNNISTEFHTEHGPFTQVPLPNSQSSLVWVTDPSFATNLMLLKPERLANKIEEQMQSMLGQITINTTVQAWPIVGLVSKTFAANRTILIGEAAHVFPPIGAQGLNLGIRDIETLLQVLEKASLDDAIQDVLKAYDRTRRPDILLRTGLVDAVNRSLLSSALPVQLASTIGLELLRSFSPLRHFFIREGLYPGSGFKAIFSSLRIGTKNAQQTFRGS